MATRVWESTVIDAPIEAIWALCRPLDFSYLGTVASAAVEGKLGASEVGSVRAITYKDKTVQKLKLTELSDAKHTVSWDLIESTPAHHVLSASYSVRLRHITQGNLTFVEWIVDFSKDVTPEVIADAAFKAKENFKALSGIAKAKLLKDGANAKIGKDKASIPQIKRQLSANSEQLHKVFQQLDKNNNGVLEFDEFALAVNKLRGENLPDEAIRTLLRDADTNHDNVVSYDEFTKWLASEKLEAKAREALHVPELKLMYFNGRGRAEIPRLIMAQAGIKYEDTRLDFKLGRAAQSQIPVRTDAAARRRGQDHHCADACHRSLFGEAERAVRQDFGGTGSDRYDRRSVLRRYWECVRRCDVRQRREIKGGKNQQILDRNVPSVVGTAGEAVGSQFQRRGLVRWQQPHRGRHNRL